MMPFRFLFVSREQAGFPTQAEWVVGWATLLWGLILLLPGDTFDNPIYFELARIATERTWGLFLTMMGAVRLIALASSWMPTANVIRAVCAIFGVIVFSLLTLAFITSNAVALQGITINVGTYVVFVVYDFISALRAGIDIGRSGFLEKTPPEKKV